MALSLNDRNVVAFLAWRAADTAARLVAFLELPDEESAHLSTLCEDAASTFHRYYAKGLNK